MILPVPQPTDTATDKQATHTAPLIKEERDTPAIHATASGPTACALRAIIMETLHSTEIPHAYSMFYFRAMQSFHVIVTASPHVPANGQAFRRSRGRADRTR